MSVASPSVEVGLFWLKTCTINGPSLDHEHESRVFASKSNRQQLTDGSSLVAESTRPLKITHGLHTAEARRNRPHSCKYPTLLMLMAEAKPFWSALYHSLTLTDREDYEYRRGSIY